MNRILKEESVFSTLMTIGMVTVMLSYNIILIFGFHTNTLLMIVRQFIPIFLIAFAVEQLVVSHNVQKLHKIFVSPSDPKFKHILIMVLLMVTSMCLLMTLITTLINIGTENHFREHYISSVLKNYPVALLAQLLVVGPIVRIIHLKLFNKSKLVS
ncbi:DUF2798 domain-containing protein [Leptospira harrisiae]|uniref:DUF2798 domain-containing protein n=1 Tax=Leptospira harrisiae TaxID=2023189 RepID=A0A2N0AKY0_9LEPT|nr:DUF2798 domain-containing protein [Leptospira harrisiae]PJZ84930.1 hypothetical protein CH364_01235 [Leptospira harrisiae]PKA08433.1 hypothetical protein CH366_01235 [Leptospira harrisiae]